MPTQPNIKAERIDGDLDINSLSVSYVTKAVAYAISTSDHTVEVTTSGATQTLPTAIGIPGKMYRILNASLGVVRVATTSSQTIGNLNSGNPTFIDLQPEEWLDVISNNTNWRII